MIGLTVNRPQRGQIWSVRLDPTEGREQAKTRPCLIISNNKFNRSAADLVIVVPLTSKNKDIPFHVCIVPSDSGLAIESFAMPEHIRALSIRRLVKFIGAIQHCILLEVEEKIKLLLDLD